MIYRLIVVSCFAAMSFAQSYSSRSYSTNADPQLAVYLEQALDRNPTVRQSFARYRAALQRLPQVSALPDPMLAFKQANDWGPRATGLTFSQRFPWFGKLSDKEMIAAKEAAALREQHEAQKDEVIRQLKFAYYDLAYIDRAIRIAEEDQALLEHYETLAQARYAQGVGLQQAVIRLQAEITRVRNRLEHLRSQRVSAEASLNTLLDLPARSPVGGIVLETRPGVEIHFDALTEIGRNHRPEVQAALLQIEKDEGRIHLARKNYWPDFTLGASFINVSGRPGPPAQNGRNIYSFTAGVNIPIRRRKYDAAVIEATEDRIGSREGYRSVLNSVEAAVRAVGFRIQTLEEQITLFERTLLPQAEQALRSTETAYSTGTLGVLELLDSERVLLEVRLGLEQLRSEYMKSLAEMERAIGAPFPQARP